jgi:hypothetical protein
VQELDRVDAVELMGIPQVVVEPGVLDFEPLGENPENFGNDGIALH